MTIENVLSHWGVDYSGSGLQGSPIDILLILKKLNLTRKIIAGKLFPIFYRTPAYSAVVVQNNPNATDQRVIDEMNQAVEDAAEIALTGDLEETHAALDRINAYRMIAGGIMSTKSDFDILCNGNSPVAVAGRFIASERLRYAQALKDNPDPSQPVKLPGSPIPFFDTVEGFKAIQAA